MSNRYENSLKRHPEKWKKNCPTCNKEIVFTHYVSFCAANKNSKSCQSCTKKKAFENIEFKEQFLKNALKGSLKKGFKGKKHTKETLKKIKGTQFKKGDINNTKSIYECWLEKYSKEDADKKMEVYKEIQRKNSQGVNNPMYGKPSPQGSGNGWSGWYKGWFFRSLLELSYMINVIERFNLVWENAENKKYKIKYTDWNNQNRNYFADFIIDKKYIVECKPKKLFNTPKVILKKKAAEEFAIKLGLKYKLKCPRKLSKEEINLLYTEKKIKFLPKYEEKYLKLYESK